MPDSLEFVVVFALGLAFGSFANVVIWRFPRGESLSFPPSRCPGCDTPISWRDNVPVISWMLLRGRCRSCGEPISVRYPVVEAASGVLWVLAWLRFGNSIATVFAIGLFYLLLILAFIDADTMRLPNPLVAFLGGWGVVGVLVSTVAGLRAVPLIIPSQVAPWSWALFGLALGGGIALLMSVVYAVVRKAAGLGMGDVKLLGVMGLFLGPYVLLSLFFGSLFGSVFALASGGGKVAGRRIPFGPFLAMGGVATALVGPAMVGWYLGLL